MLKRFVLALFGVVLAAFAGFIIAMRAKYPPVLDAVRKLAKFEVNPEQMKTAGQPGAYASIIRHVGRTSGTAYETPVQAVKTEHGFAIPLPYADRSDWFKNVLASGKAELVHEGVVYKTDRPEVAGWDAVESYFAEKDRPMLRLFNVDQFLMMHSADVETAVEQTTEVLST
jgi:hypothetical protein